MSAMMVEGGEHDDVHQYGKGQCDLPLHHEDDVLGDIGGQVGDSLQMTRSRELVHRTLDGGGIFLHLFLKHNKHLPVDPVDFVVPCHNGARQSCVLVDQSIETFMNHASDAFDHLGKVQ